MADPKLTRKTRAGPLLVLHSTEGSTIAGAVATMDANRSWSNWVGDPKTGTLKTLVDSERGDRSLKNLPGGVETNNRPGVWQLEIVGFAEDMPTYGDTWYRSLAAMVVQICDAKGIPKRFPYPFVPYPRSYGFRAAQRLTGHQWLACSGIIGHQHVPENDHGDPGDLNRLIPLVEGDPMPDLDPDLVRALQEAINAAGSAPRLLVDGLLGPKTLAAATGAARGAKLRGDEIGRLEAQISELEDQLADPNSHPDGQLAEDLRSLIARALP
jgi:hypothetical protein